ncbi:MAG: HAD family hydrolase, partial [Lachnospiraceae bacterium]|nr:HAD family hydrolase [Lachnospiraceae bacterium]
MIKTVLFDLDGTLLPMDQDTFTNAYFKELAKKMAPFGYNPDELVKGVWKGTGAMVRNDGTKTNEEAFWEVFLKIFGEEHKKDLDTFTEFYENEFNKAKGVCGFNEASAEVIATLKEKDKKVVLASNPLFPMIAQKSRMNWAGLNTDDFDYITSYENSHFCKPSKEYYVEIAELLDLNPEECLMVGNNATEDMVAREAGMNVFLLTDCLINDDNVDLSQFRQGGFRELKELIDEL